MRTDRFFVKACDKKFFFAQDSAANGAHAAAVALYAVNTAGNMHKAVVAAKGRESGGFDPLALVQPGAADRAGTGRTGEAFAFWFRAAPAFKHRHGDAAGYGKKKGKTKIEQYYADKG